MRAIASSTKIKMAFSTLQKRGFAVRIGNKKGSKLQITALGRDKVYDIMQKFVVNC